MYHWGKTKASAVGDSIDSDLEAAVEAPGPRYTADALLWPNCPQVLMRTN